MPPSLRKVRIGSLQLPLLACENGRDVAFILGWRYFCDLADSKTQGGAWQVIEAS